MPGLDDLDVRARAVLAGGASSPVRAGRRVGGKPFFQTRGSGALAYDDTGRAYIDYLMGYGPLLFGYRMPGVERVKAQYANGVLFGSTHQEEVRLAERIRRHLPSMQLLRFATTGTEAVMGAVRVARSATQRDVLVRFGGNYHGHSDLALLDAGASAETADVQRSGIPQGVAADIRILRYNDSAALQALLDRDGDRIAAVLVEPIVGNMGLVLPRPGFLEELIRAAHAVGALVIFDEVITWLRVGLRGAQGLFRLEPDLTTIGKILGGGLPIAAFGGKAEVMQALAPDGAVFTGGTHAAHPLAITAAHAVLDELEQRPELYTQMDLRAQRLAAGLRDVFRRAQLPYEVLQLASIVDFKFRPGPVIQNYDEAKQADAAKFARYYHEMRDRGILLAPSYNEVMFLSTEHLDEHVDATIAAADASIQTILGTSELAPETKPRSYFGKGLYVFMAVKTKAHGVAVTGAHDKFTPFSYDLRELSPDDIQIEIAYCGVCHSDIHQARNEWGGSTFPMVPGHEIAGRVTAVGPQVTKFREGDLAGVGCMVDSCRQCDNCKAGEEQFCRKGASFTYNSKLPDGTPTYGGYANSLVVDQAYALKLPTNLDLAATAPLLCAGITTYSPLRHWNVGKGQKVGIVGLGGLGHMGLKFAHAMGAHVVQFTTSAHKQEEALRLGADEVIVSTDSAVMEKHLGSFDFILDTVSAPHDLNAFLALLNRNGTMVLVGMPDKPPTIEVRHLVMSRGSLAGSLIGGIAETQEMLDYCGEHGITSDIEIIPIQQIETAYERVLKSDVKYRFVIDLASINAQTPAV